MSRRWVGTQGSEQPNLRIRLEVYGVGEKK